MESTKSESINPSVVLSPLLYDTGDKKFCFTTIPAIAGIFNEPTLSDIQLLVNDTIYYGHKNVLSAASDVFASMVGGNWAESRDDNKVITLQEDVDCAKHFRTFLYFMYSGKVYINNLNVVPLFLLADKYNVTPLLQECTKIIEIGLKVFVVSKDNCFSFTPSKRMKMETELTAYSLSLGNDSGFRLSDENGSTLSTETFQLSNCVSSNTMVQKNHIVPSETFPVSTLLKLLQFCPNKIIHQTALFNLEARIGNQIIRGKYEDYWNGLTLELIIEMLSDDKFCYDEYVLFKAAISWLKAYPYRNEQTIIDSVLSKIRFCFMKPQVLYAVSKHPFVENSKVVSELISETVKYLHFKDWLTEDDLAKYVKPEFTPRYILEV